MSDIVQLYSDKPKTKKAYPKTLASETYMSNGGTVESEFDKVIANVTNGNESITNSEIVQARGEEINLNARLNKFDSQLEHNMNEINEQFNTKANINEVVIKGKGTLNDFDEETRIAILENNQIDINYVLGESNVLNENIRDKSVRPNKTTFISETRNLFDKQQFVKGIVSSVNGEIVPNDNFASSNFIRFEKGKTYKIKSCYDYAVYNKDKVFVRGVEHAKSELEFSSSSDDEKYIIFTMDLADVETNMMCENELPDHYIDGSFGKNGEITLTNELKDAILKFINSQKTYRWSNKKWCVIGDSITEHNSTTSKNYHDYIKEVINCEVYNFGVSGTGYTETTSTPNNRFIQRLDGISKDMDLITVLGGINDLYFGTKPLGQFGDKTGDTFYGAVDELLLALINKFPNKSIGVFTPLKSVLSNTVNSRGETLDQYVQAIIEVCNYYAIPVLDLNKISGLNPNIEVIKNTYIPDGTHPNADGHEKIAYKILSFLENL